MPFFRSVFRHSFTACLLLVTSIAAAQSSVEAGVYAYKRGDYEKALSVFRPLARQGVPRAQAILGLMYSYGEGVAVDHAEAARWYREAAKQNYPVAQYNLGMLYIEGKGVDRDVDEGVKWLERAAAGGHFRARNALRNFDRAAHDALPQHEDDALVAPPSTFTAGTIEGAPEAPAAAPANAHEAGAEPPRSVVLTSSRNDAPAPQERESPPARAQEATDPPATSSELDAVYQVQLAASRSQELIERDWSAVKKANPDLLAGLESSIERAEIGEERTVWYRLRVGPFATKSEAEGLCERLGKRRVDFGCLPLRTRP